MIASIKDIEHHISIDIRHTCSDFISLSDSGGLAALWDPVAGAGFSTTADKLIRIFVF